MTIKELLAIDFLVDKLVNASVQDKAIIIAELKAKARELKCVAQLNSQLKIAEAEALKIKQQEIQGEQYLDIPEEIQNTAGYVVTEYGVEMFLPNSDVTINICPKPIFVTERYQDIHTLHESVKLVYKTDGKWRDIIVGRDIVANANRIMNLSAYPTGITSENARNIVKYLTDIESENRQTIPIKQSVSKLGWTEHGFIPFTKDIHFVGSESYLKLYENYTTKGDYNIWREFSIKALQYPLPKVMVGAAYASLLLDKLGINGFSTHIWGESGRGKTILMMLAASVYGNPDSKRGIIRNGETTANGIEPVLDFSGDCAVFFDELTCLTTDQISSMVYKHAQGQGKTRMTRAANLQKTYSWNNVMLLSSEKPTYDYTTMSGAVNRVISLYSGTDVFDGSINMTELAELMRANYGFGAELFIKNLHKYDIQSLFNRNLAKISDNNIEKKQINAICAIMTAYEIAAGEVYNNPDRIYIADIKECLATDEEVSVTMRAYESILAWAAANYRMFDDSSIGVQSKWGKYQDDYLLIYPDKFREYCTRNNYNYLAILKELMTRKLLKRTSNRYYFKTSAIGDYRKREWFVAIKIEKNLIDELEEVEKDENLMF